jgi:ATP-dependent DNA helicase RecQ
MQLLSYFGERNTKPCGICSVCAKKQTVSKSSDLKAIKENIIELLENGDMSSRAMISSLNCSEKDLKQVIVLLLEHQIIKITKTNTYKLFHQ